jgi:hypothetical protein
VHLWLTVRARYSCTKIYPGPSAAPLVYQKGFRVQCTLLWPWPDCRHQARQNLHHVLSSERHASTDMHPLHPQISTKDQRNKQDTQGPRQAYGSRAQTPPDQGAAAAAAPPHMHVTPRACEACRHTGHRQMHAQPGRDRKAAHKLEVQQLPAALGKSREASPLLKALHSSEPAT